MIEISVSDTGIGIDSANSSKIFSYGFTTKKGGHGFGLHNSSLAAKDIGAELTFESRGHNLGSTFILRLPKKFKGVVDEA